MCILFPMVFYSLINSVYVCVDTCVYKYVGRCACTYVCIQVETKGQLDTVLQVLATHFFFQYPLTGLELTNYTKTHLSLTLQR